MFQMTMGSIRSALRYLLYIMIMPQAHTVNCTGLTGPSVFAPLAETLFFAARPFHPPKNDSFGPRVPMSTFSRPSETMLPRNCHRH